MVSGIIERIRKAIYKSSHLFMLLRMMTISILGAYIVALSSDKMTIVLTGICLVLYTAVEVSLIEDWESRNKYWYRTIEDMQFYFEANDNRLQWFMELIDKNYNNMYRRFCKEKTYVQSACSYEFCKYILARVEYLSNFNSKGYKCFICECMKDMSRGTQLKDPNAKIPTHVLMVFHTHDTQYTTPVIIDPFYNMYMPEIVDQSDTANVHVITDREEAEDVYHITAVYDVHRCAYIEIGGHVKEFSTKVSDHIRFDKLRKFIQPGCNSTES